MRVGCLGASGGMRNKDIWKGACCFTERKIGFGACEGKSANTVLVRKGRVVLEDACDNIPQVDCYTLHVGWGRWNMAFCLNLEVARRVEVFEGQVFMENVIFFNPSLEKEYSLCT